MKDTGTNPTKWRDPAGNVYSVEKSAKTGRFIVIRTNPGGNRKIAKRFEPSADRGHGQKVLDTVAPRVGWKEVAE